MVQANEDQERMVEHIAVKGFKLHTLLAGAVHAVILQLRS